VILLFMRECYLRTNMSMKIVLLLTVVSSILMIVESMQRRLETRLQCVEVVIKDDWVMQALSQ
jgi:hypothetical protein